MAAAGKIAGLHMVSSDKQNWTPADQVKGLFGPSEAEIAAQQVAARQEAAAQAAAQAAASAAADTASNYAAPGDAKFCRTCGTPVHEHATACTKCGMQPRVGRTYCFHCGGRTHPQAVTCVNCGLLLAAEGTGGAAKLDSLWGYFVKCLGTHYAAFSGRASRAEYWGYTLFMLLISLFVVLITGGLAFLVPEIAPLTIVCAYLWSAALLLPTLAVTWRRFHDIGVSGGTAIPVLIAFQVGSMGVTTAIVARVVEFVQQSVARAIGFGGGGSANLNAFVAAAIILTIMGFIPLLWASITDSESGDNRFGPNPKGL